LSVEAIRTLQYRYARALDDRDVEGVVAYFTRDADVAVEGAEEPITDLRAFFAGLAGEGKLNLGEVSTHVMANVLVELDGDRATAQTDGVVHLLRGGIVLVRGVRYSDVCACTGAGWLIARRRHQALWQFNVPAAAVSVLTRAD